MYLKRKDTADIIVTPDGIEHPDAVIAVVDYKNFVQDERLVVYCKVFHSIAAYEAGASPLPFQAVEFAFSSNESAPIMDGAAAVVAMLQSGTIDYQVIEDNISFGQSTYTDVLDGSISLDASVEILTDTAKLWIMEQEDTTDSLKDMLYKNWNLHEDDGTDFDYEDTLLAVLTA